MDFKNAPKKRTTNFREDETKLLIQLWGSPTVQNKLYLTHRKAPVMRLIAANMQKHGFYRTPDEIKTRIRNLKCLYHRIKKSMTTGTGIGTVDPDWPHYKAMDEILSKKNALRQSLVYNHNLLSEVSAGIKEEIEDIDIDDGASYTSNSNGSDDEFEETPCALPATITPLIIEDEEEPAPSTSNNSLHVKIAPKPSQEKSPVPTTTASSTFPRIQIAQNLLPQVSIAPRLAPTINAVPKIQNIQAGNVVTNVSTASAKLQTATIGGNGVAKQNSPLPFPLLILNGMPPNGVQGGQNGTNGLMQKVSAVGSGATGGAFNAEVSNILKEMLMIQKENLEVEKERLEVERQKLEYERTVGCQLMNMFPVFNEIAQRFHQQSDPEPEEEQDTKNFVEHPNFNQDKANGCKRPADDPLGQIKITKIFKESVINGIKKYMLTETPISNGDTNSDKVTS